MKFMRQIIDNNVEEGETVQVWSYKEKRITLGIINNADHYG